MEKICRSATAFYRLPTRASQLNVRVNVPLGPSPGQTWLNNLTIRTYTNTIQKQATKPAPKLINNVSVRNLSRGNEEHQNDDQAMSLVDILDREIKDESAELNRHLQTDQFPGFSIETDGADVKLIRKVDNAVVTVNFTVSSSLADWPSDEQEPPTDPQQPPEMSTTLLSMPEFHVQISKGGKTLEVSCFFEEFEHDEETGESFSAEPIFSIDELVLYDGEPKETEFAVSAEYFQDDLQEALLNYLAKHGIDEEFSKNLVSFSTSYEKKQYISLMKRLKSFVA